MASKSTPSDKPKKKRKLKALSPSLLSSSEAKAKAKKEKPKKKKKKQAASKKDAKPKKPKKAVTKKTEKPKKAAAKKAEPKNKAKTKAAPSKSKKKATAARPSKKKSKQPAMLKALRPAVIGDSLSCGMLLFQRGERPLVLVLWRKDGSPDLPKGHTRPGESDMAAALRELREETGIMPSRITFTPGFAFENTYRTKSKKIPGALINKTVRVFHAEITGPVVVDAHEHAGYAWIDASDLRSAQREVHDNPTFAAALRAWRHHLQRKQG